MSYPTTSWLRRVKAHSAASAHANSTIATLARLMRSARTRHPSSTKIPAAAVKRANPGAVPVVEHQRAAGREERERQRQQQFRAPHRRAPREPGRGWRGGPGQRQQEAEHEHGERRGLIRQRMCVAEQRAEQIGGQATGHHHGERCRRYVQRVPDKGGSPRPGARAARLRPARSGSVLSGRARPAKSHGAARARRSRRARPKPEGTPSVGCQQRRSRGAGLTPTRAPRVVPTRAARAWPSAGTVSVRW